MSRVGKPISTKSKLVITQGLGGRRGFGKCLLMGIRVSFASDKNLLKLGSGYCTITY